MLTYPANASVAQPFSLAPSLRVLHVVRSLEVGGLERMVCELINARSFDCSRVACLVARGPFADLLEERGGTVYDLSAIARGRRALLNDLIRVVQAYQPDVIHCHNMYSHFLGSLAAIYTGRRPTVLTKHGTYFPRGWISPFAHRVLLRRSRIVAVSQEIHSKLLDWAPFVRGRLTCIPNGVSLPTQSSAAESAATRERLGWAPDEWIFITISRIVPAKRVDVMLQAFRKVRDAMPRCRLVIVGDGPALGDIRRIAAEKSLSDSVQFLGQRMDVALLLGSADAFAMSSDNEGLPMALLEAMAVGLPVVATRVGEIPNVVRDGSTGLLVARQSPDALADAMLHLASSPDAARDIGARAAQDIMARYSVQATVQQYEEMYRLAASRQ